ncbi:hypothetical protein CVT24_000780 [Panaeolus cyanescens]|uniref:Protein kinase domain-containing protein n=1 Tax=Panaeolus cyanescens TaxID=181874 RepID=A0A409YCM5_9AGAR|nr:hypothetical protein CVT24_000780 [Panaeolus cyanescens]
MQNISDSPPKAPPIKYTAPLGTRWAKEKAAAGGASAFDLPTDPKTIGPWILGECIGKGASGRVKIAKHRRTGQLAAVKILPVAPLVNSRASLATQQAKSDKQRLGIDREITMMKLMNHPNIMRIYDVFEGEKELFLVLEYVEGGELFDFLVNRGRLPPDEALIYFRQIVYGLNYAHTFSIIHRDLKPENILISSLSPPLIKIADWGMAAFAPPTLELETSCGSPHYASPEIVNGEKYQGNATDIWSCGVILYALLTGRLPFDDKNVRTLLAKVKSGKYDMPSWIDPLAKDLLSKMLIVDVTKRITIPEILSHPWLVSRPAIPFASTDGATFTLLAPPLPPSPSILARPIESPDLIDLDLFESLRIIWGRHADPEGESIRRDLCAPAGHGVHAKAFYFLLRKYREASLKNRSNDFDFQQPSQTAIPALELKSLALSLDWELDLPEKAHGSMKERSKSGPASPTDLPNSTHPSFDKSLALLASRKRAVTQVVSTKERPDGAHMSPDPVKPLPLNTKVDDNQAVNGGRVRTSVGTVRRPSKPLAPRRMYTQSVISDGVEGSDDKVTSMGFAQHLHQIQARATSGSNRPRSTGGTVLSETERKMMLSGSRVVSAPAAPSHSAAVKAGYAIKSDESKAHDRALPLLTAPKTDNPHLQRTIDDITQKVNDLVQAVTQAAPAAVEEKEVNKSSTRKAEEEKENRSIDEEGWSHVSADSDPSSGVGLGVGIAHNRDLGKDIQNTVSGSNSPAKVKKEKEKKARPPPLELPSSNPKRTTLGMLGSPIALNSPIHPPASANRILTSPVVGEFKGWFSNLFNWKSSNAQGGVLYSTDDIYRTRTDVGRTLENLGIILTYSSSDYPLSDQVDVIFCRVDQPIIDPTSGMQLKGVKFRVEFRASPGPSNAASVSGEEQSYPSIASQAQQASTLVTPSTASGSRPRTSLLIGRSTAQQGSIPSPMALSKWEFPPGYLCAIALVHEKGSVSTFRAVWRRLKQEYGDASTAYPCFSPAFPNTPYTEAHPSQRSAAI